MELKMSLSKWQQIAAHSSSSRQKQSKTTTKNPNAILNNVTDIYGVAFYGRKDLLRKMK